MTRSRELAELATAYDTGTPLGMRNRIINGAMAIDQRNAGASITPLDAQYSVDRWGCYRSQASKYSVQQNAGAVTPPAGFTNYLGATSLSAYSSVAADYFGLAQSVEGLNFGDLAFGTANAKTVTLSFWVRSSLTGTHGGSLRNSANNRTFCFSYSVAAANTWEFKTITVPGDTTGTWLTTNGVGLNVWFDLGSGSTATGTAGAWNASNVIRPTGSVSVVGTNGATWQITGVQLEAGSVATPFERRPYGTELQLCSRYYQEAGQVVALFNSPTSNATRFVQYSLNPEMRVTPTVTVVSLGEFTLISTTNRLGNSSKLVQIEGTVGSVNNYGYVSQITFSSEL
jgi:hypothetical protein